MSCAPAGIAAGCGSIISIPVDISPSYQSQVVVHLQGCHKCGCPVQLAEDLPVALLRRRQLREEDLEEAELPPGHLPRQRVPEGLLVLRRERRVRHQSGARTTTKRPLP